MCLPGKTRANRNLFENVDRHALDLPNAQKWTRADNVSNWQKTAATNQKALVKGFITLWSIGSHAPLNNFPPS